MKVEIDRDNRSVFFQQYHRQYVDSSSGRCRLRDADGVDNINWIELIPLSDISDEDALEFSDIRKIGLPSIKLGKRMIEMFVNGDDINLEEVDYLRSKGYALPWMNLSVDALVKIGWVKLRVPKNED